MQTTTLGTSQITTSRLAYGCWRIATTADETHNYNTAKTAVFAALDTGFTLFDHADIYCNGVAEEIFGRILADNPGLREKMVIATKCGIRLKNHPHGAPARYDFSKEHIISQCEHSLKRLRIDTIDLLHLHRPDYLMNAEEVAEAFTQLRQSGKVREFGVSNFRRSQVSLLQSVLDFPIVVNQVEISLLQLKPFENGILDHCQEKKITPLAWSPLGGGLLADGGKDLLPGQMDYEPSFVVAIIDWIAKNRGVSREVISLSWLLKHPAGIVPIVGSTSPERIRRMATATDVELTREEWYHLLTAARKEPLP